MHFAICLRDQIAAARTLRKSVAQLAAKIAALPGREGHVFIQCFAR